MTEAANHSGITVTLIGGGAAGTLAALNLHQVPGISRIIMIDATGRFGRGLAYSAKGAWHRLNVPAQRMGGCFEHDTSAFHDWWMKQVAQPRAYHELFASRAQYGDFLASRLQALVDAGDVELCFDAATRIDHTDHGYTVHTGQGAAIRSDIVVLCLGNHAPAPLPNVPASDRVIQNMWEDGVFDAVKPREKVLIIGTAATAIDAVLELHNRKLDCDVTMLSRRGLLPLEDAPPLDEPLTFKLPPDLNLRQVFHAVRVEVERQISRGIPWQAVVDAFRKEISAVWQKLSEDDRRRFGRHLRSIWMVHRHRLAPDVAAKLRELQRNNRLHVEAGRIRHAELRPAGYDVTIKTRDGRVSTLAIDRIINCTGPNERYDTIDNPLVQSLLAQHQARLGPNGLGLDVTVNHELINRSGAPNKGLYALGPATRGTFWEVTAVTNIRAQAVALAEYISEPALQDH